MTYYSNTTPKSPSCLKVGLKIAKGFSLLEVTFALAVIAFMLAFYFHLKDNLLKIRQARSYAEQTLEFGKIFTDYIINHRAALLGLTTSSSPTIIGLHDISELLPQGILINNQFGQIPCASIIKNDTTNSLEAIMYYVSAQAVKISLLNISTIRRAGFFLAGSGGYYDGNNIQGIGNKSTNWSIATNSPYLLNSTECKLGYQLWPQSLVLNLNMLPQYNQNLEPAIALWRNKDTLSPEALGSVNNKNTLMSDIYIASKQAIKMNNAGNITLAKDDKLNNINVNSDFMAASIMPTQYVSPGTACSSDQLGSIAKESATNNSQIDLLARSNVICNYNPPLCGGNGFCYQPMITNTVDYINAGSNWLGDRFICPKEVPFALKGSSDANTILMLAYYTDIHNFFNSQQKLQCSGGIGDRCTVASGIHVIPRHVIEPANDKITTSNQGAYIQESYNGYSFNIGYQTSAPTCNDLCKSLPATNHEPSCAFIGAIPSSFVDSNNGKRYCFCQPISRSYLCSYSAIEELPNNATPHIKLVSCTNKPIYQKQ